MWRRSSPSLPVSYHRPPELPPLKPYNTSGPSEGARHGHCGTGAAEAAARRAGGQEAWVQSSDTSFRSRGTKQRSGASYLKREGLWLRQSNKNRLLED